MTSAARLRERDVTIRYLRLINESKGLPGLIQASVEFFQQQSGCEAVGIRLKEGDDYPYCEARGFPRDFLLVENQLCARDAGGRVLRDEAGLPVIECMCGNVISGRFDVSKSFFTTGGSFWSNNTTRLLASTTEADRQSRTRNRCNGAGYESVALLPLVMAGERLGLLQLNDHRPDVFSRESIVFWEMLTDQLSVAVAKFRADEARARALEQNAESQAMFLQAQKLGVVGRLAGGIAHDFNNLLAVIIGLAQLLEDQVHDRPKALADAREILAAADRAAALTKRLLVFSRRQVLAPAVIGVNEAVQGALPLLRPALGAVVGLEVSLAGGLPCVRLDPDQFQQVLLNLALNAREAMPGGGRLRIETSLLERSKEVLARHPGLAAGPHVLLAAKDSGPGIPADILPHVFEPFFTTKPKEQGAGLGLSMVYGFVMQSGGTISAFNEPGGGAVFELCFQAVDQPAPRTAAPSAERPASGSKTILLVEDDAAVRRFAARCLRLAGFEVLEAGNADEALACGRQAWPRLRLLVSDVVMPGLSGTELARRLRAMVPGLRVLFVSGYADDALSRHGLLKPGVRLLAKPFTPAALTNAALEILQATRSEGQD
ncbi:MAG: response regulator [Elusimicrobia bacterium]|nr:response regulator [Elusimicrobiota bacterium]